MHIFYIKFVVRIAKGSLRFQPESTTKDGFNGKEIMMLVRK